MLSLYKLEIFLAVVEEGTFSGAAKRLFMTQPAVSQHIQDLEASLGATLFNRHKRGAVLTPTGIKLYEYTRQILYIVAEAENAVTNVERLQNGQLTLAATPGISVYLLPEWLGGFRNKYPNLTVSLQTGTTTEVVSSLLGRGADLGFVEGELPSNPNENVGQVVLQPIALYVVVGKDHAWRTRETLPVALLHGQPFITRQVGSRTRTWIDATLARYGVKPRIVGEFDNPEAIKQAVLSNIGLTILPDYVVRHEINQKMLYALPLEDVKLERQMSLVWDKRQQFNPITRAFLAYLRGFFPHLEL